MIYKKQVEKSHYAFDQYVDSERWMSYFHQIDEVMKVAKRMDKKTIKVLEIGIGNGLVANVLRNMGMKVVTMDIDPELKPDIVGVLPEINIAKGEKFDCILCCEVLEHIEYKDAEKSLKNMAKAAIYVVISVPHKGLWLSFSVKFMFSKAFKIILTFPTNFRKHKLLGEHYWELGARDYCIEKFNKSLNKAEFKLLDQFRSPDLPWHHFFILKNTS